MVTLLNEYFVSGYHKVVWDGKNKNGQTVSSGIYIYELQAGNERLVKKMMLVR